jgi:hypothetical protein
MPGKKFSQLKRESGSLFDPIIFVPIRPMINENLKVRFD